ncbi:hypothetical protein BZG36_05434, partial [Bifiguratus adelaidae]
MALALHDYSPDTPLESTEFLRFKHGNIISVLSEDPSGWWDGELNGERGWFPSNYVVALGETQGEQAEKDSSTKEKQCKLSDEIMEQLEIHSGVDAGETDLAEIWDIYHESVRRAVGNFMQSLSSTRHLSTGSCLAAIVAQIRSMLCDSNLLDSDSILLTVHYSVFEQRHNVCMRLGDIIHRCREADDVLKRGTFDTTRCGGPFETADDAIVEDILARAGQLPVALADLIKAAILAHIHIGRDESNHSSLVQIHAEMQHNGSANDESTSKEHHDVSSHLPAVANRLAEQARSAFDTVNQQIAECSHYVLNTSETASRDVKAALLGFTKDILVEIKAMLNVVDSACILHADYPEAKDPFKERRRSHISTDPQLMSLLLAKEALHSSAIRFVYSARQASEAQTEQGLTKVSNELLALKVVTGECFQVLLNCLQVTNSYQPQSHTSLIAGELRYGFDNGIDHIGESKIDRTKHQVIGGESSSALNDWEAEPKTSKPAGGTRKTQSLFPRPASSKSTPSGDSVVVNRRRGLSVGQQLPPKNELGSVARYSSPSRKVHLQDNMQHQSNSLDKRRAMASSFYFPYRSISGKDIILNADGDILAATLDALIEHMTSPFITASCQFYRIFFINFRLFTTSMQLMIKLKNRYNIGVPAYLSMKGRTEEENCWDEFVSTPIKAKMYYVIKLWIEEYLNLEHDSNIEQELRDFINVDMDKHMPKPARRLSSIMHQRFDNSIINNVSQTDPLSVLGSRQTRLHHGAAGSASSSLAGIFGNSALEGKFDDITADDSPQPLGLSKSLMNQLRRSSGLSSINVADFDATELARQITILEFKLFSSVTANELIGQEFSKQVSTSASIHIKAMSQLSTQISRWVANTILHETDAKRRANLIKFFIKVGQECLNLRNFNTLMAIRSALESSSVARLRKSWDHVSTKQKAAFSALLQATDSSRNFANYRSRLKQAAPPALPFLGVYLTDLTFID